MKILICIIAYLIIGILIMGIVVGLSEDGPDLWAKGGNVILGGLVIIYPLVVACILLMVLGRLTIKLATKVKGKGAEE